MKTAFIIQARMGSTRLPNKVLLPFYQGKCMLQLLVEKLRQIEDVSIIIATSEGKENDAIQDFCQSNGVICFRGDEKDLLKRFIGAAEANGIEGIVRICSDNPFLELDSIKALLSKASTSDAEYISFNISGTPSILTHYGFWTEYTTLTTLKKVQNITDESYYHEHVTVYIYKHPSEFKIEWIEGPECIKDHDNIRLTIDTPEDLENAKKIYADICSVNPYPTISDVVCYLDKHPDMYQSMSQQISKNTKK